MKKGLTMLVAAMVIFGLICMIGTAAAAPHIEISTSTEVIGKGVYDSELLMQNSICDSGVKYYGEAYTPSLGMHGPSTMILSSEYILTTGNHTELQVSEESEITHMQAKRCFKNYGLGSLQAFNTRGDYNIMAEFGGDVNMSSMMVEAEVNGRALSEIIVTDLNATRFFITRDKATYNGNYSIMKSSLIERVEEPRAGYDDWLGCP